MANDFIKLTNMNQKQSQIDALSKIGEYKTGINGGRVVWNGTDLSVFQGDINNFQKTNLGGFNEEQLQTIFAALDVNADGTLDMNEIKSFAALGEDKDGIIDNDKNIIDELDFAALYEMAQDYVDKSLEDDVTDVNTKPTTTTTTTDTTNTTTTTTTTNKTDSTTVTEKTEEKVQSSKIDATLSDNEATAKATQLYNAMKGWGTDEDTVNGILLESGYNSADIVKIMNAYQKQYGESLMEWIQDDFSGHEEDALREALYAASAEQAQQALGWQSVDDIPAALAQTASEYYTGFTSGSNNKTAENLYNLSASEKTQIMVAMDMLYPDKSAMERITEHWYGLAGHSEDTYVDDIMNSMLQVAGQKPTTTNNNTTTTTTTDQTEQKTETPKTKATLSDNEATAKATQLYNAMKGFGTDEDTINGILLESGYNSADIVKIMDAYQNQYGESLMEWIQDDFSGQEETVLREALYAASSQQALESMGWQTVDDIPADIAQKASEFYTGFTSGSNNKTAEKLYNLSASEKAQIMVAMDVLYPDKSAMERITEHWYGLAGHSEDTYVDNIMNSMLKVAKG